jgi:hypothetical protein
VYINAYAKLNNVKKEFLDKIKINNHYSATPKNIIKLINWAEELNHPMKEALLNSLYEKAEYNYDSELFQKKGEEDKIENSIKLDSSALSMLGDNFGDLNDTNKLKADAELLSNIYTAHANTINLYDENNNYLGKQIIRANRIKIDNSDATPPIFKDLENVLRHQIIILNQELNGGAYPPDFPVTTTKPFKTFLSNFNYNIKSEFLNNLVKLIAKINLLKQNSKYPVLNHELVSNLKTFQDYSHTLESLGKSLDEPPSENAENNGTNTIHIINKMNEILRDIPLKSVDVNDLNLNFEELSKEATQNYTSKTTHSTPYKWMELLTACTAPLKLDGFRAV